ncbi:MAG TPA: hypothetical protein PLO43_03825, partial [Chlamydiales bacterium]|nr:hypothetical protein [Chlamydiales bacterium]
MFEVLPALSPTSKIQPTQLEKVQAPYRFNDQVKPATPHPTPYTPSKPQLPSPRDQSKTESHYMWKILRLVETTDKLEKDLMWMLTTDQEDLINNLSKLAKQEQEKTHLAEKAGQSMTNWSYLNRIASCLFAGATIAVGWYLTGNADVSSWISYGMIAAGAGSIGAIALAEMDIYPNLMRMMALGTGTLGLILGGG